MISRMTCSFLVDAFFMKAQSNMIALNKDKVLPPGTMVKDALSQLNDCQGDLQFLGLRSKHLFSTENVQGQALFKT
jgi:hypothetical protein